MCCVVHNFHRHAVAVAADDICIVQRKHGDVLISVYGGKDPPTEATDTVAKQVRSMFHEPACNLLIGASFTGCLEFCRLLCCHTITPFISSVHAVTSSQQSSMEAVHMSTMQITGKQ